MSKITTKIEIDGMKQLNAALEQLSRSGAGRVTRAAVSAGGRIIRKEAKANARKIKRTGALAKSTDMKVKTYKKSGNTVAIIGPRADYVTTFTRPKRGGGTHAIKANPSKYAHLVELGTEHSAAKPFLRAALMTSRGAVAATMGQKAKEALAREVKKVYRKGGL